MNNSRLRALEDAQTGIARKVLQAVPIQEQWPLKRVVEEVVRCGSTRDIRIISGCLKSLVDTGLITEQNGVFQRCGPKQEHPQPIRPKETVVPISSAKEFQLSLDPLTQMGNLANNIRDCATRMNEFAAKIEETALQLQMQIEAAKTESDKFRQLQALLKDLGAP